MTHDAPADRAIDRFYDLPDSDPRECDYGMMLVQNVLYRVTIESVSRSGKTVRYTCNGFSAVARRDVTGEWQAHAEPHWPIRFIARNDPAKKSPK